MELIKGSRRFVGSGNTRNKTMTPSQVETEGGARQVESEVISHYVPSALLFGPGALIAVLAILLFYSY